MHITISIVAAPLMFLLYPIDRHCQGVNFNYLGKFRWPLALADR